jgi:uncharacterized hydrophobic protein (TIGR00271 family)
VADDEQATPAERPVTPMVDPSEVDDEEISTAELDEVAEHVAPARADVAQGPTSGGDADAGEVDEADEVDELPGHVATVVVPLANPQTAADLLAIGLAFCEHDGEVIGVLVTTDDAQAETAAAVTSQLEDVLDGVRDRHPGRELEVVTRSATSVARGIVELAREENAGLIVLGAATPGAGAGAASEGPPLGRIAEAVIEVAPCDVVVLRPGQDDEHVRDLERVVVAVDGGEPSRTAARSGIVLAEGLGLDTDVVHVQDTGRPRWDGLAVLARSLDGVHGRNRCRTRLLQGPDVAGVLITSTDVTELVVVGLSRGTGLRNWLFGSVARGLVRDARGPVLVVARHVVSEGISGRFERLRGWLRPSLTEVEQETLRWNARRQATTTIDYVTLLGVSAILATLGLVQDSVAVIIGAMLVAPLLGPLSAMSIGLVTARTSLLRRGAITLGVGTLAAMALSLAVGWVLPLTEPTPQMLLRAEPSLLDVGVAVASGLVGAFATARKDIPAALAGVAIAAALVPPLSTAGLGVAFGDASLAGGAFLLFLVNIASVVATGAAAFWWFGLRPVEQDHATRRQLTSAVLGAGLLFVVVTATVGLLEAQRIERAAQLDVEQELTISADVELVDVEVDPQDDRIIVTATVRSERDLTNAELRAAEQELSENLDVDVDLRVVVLPVVSPS